MITWDQVAQWVASRAPESETLDFKAMFWTDKSSRPQFEEIAKDVAAFLNHRGGVLAVGVEDKNDHAVAFSRTELPKQAEQQVAQALEKHLHPPAARAAVHAYVLTGVVDGEPAKVLIVEVRGWPDGPVAVRIGDTAAYRLPVRHCRDQVA